MVNKKTKNIVLFASGSGTNVENIVKYFKGDARLRVGCVFTNKPNAGVIARATKMKIPVKVFDKSQMETGHLLEKVKRLDPDLIILAGFLLKIPIEFTQTFSDQIINIHPALLPKYGGKGMYGDRVHRAVKEAGDRETGITIHYVNEHYDQGSIIFQSKTTIEGNESIQEITDKVHQLEYTHYPAVIKKILFP